MRRTTGASGEGARRVCCRGGQSFINMKGIVSVKGALSAMQWCKCLMQCSICFCGWI